MFLSPFHRDAVFARSHLNSSSTSWQLLQVFSARHLHSHSDVFQKSYHLAHSSSICSRCELVALLVDFAPGVRHFCFSRYSVVLPTTRCLSATAAVTLSVLPSCCHVVSSDGSRPVHSSTRNSRCYCDSPSCGSADAAAFP